MPLELLNDNQMTILLDFADRCRHLCFGRQYNNSEAQSVAYREWKELSRNMNYAGTGQWKSFLEWKSYWTELKNRTKAKVGHAKRKSRFNNKPLQLNLNIYEQRIIQLAEHVAKQPRMRKSHSETSMTDDGEDVSNASDPGKPKMESVVVKVAPHHVKYVAQSVIETAEYQISNLPNSESNVIPPQRSYSTQNSSGISQNSWVHPEMINMIQAQINALQSQNSTYVEEVNQQNYEPQNLVVNPTVSVDVNMQGNTMPVQQVNVATQMDPPQGFEGPQFNSTMNVPHVNITKRDFAASPIFSQRNVPQGSYVQSEPPPVNTERMVEHRLECIRFLADAINNLADSTSSIARAQRMLASSQKSMATAQEMMAASLQNCGTWQTSLAASNETLARALKRLRDYVSRLHQLIRTMMLAPLLLAGLNEEKQQIHVELFSDFEDDQSFPVTDAYVEVQSRFAQVYACELQIEAHFHGLRYIMFNWPKVSAVIGICTNLFFVSLVFILSWYQLQDGLPDFVKFQSKFKTEVKSESPDDEERKKLEELAGKMKLEREDSSTFFEDSFLEDLALPPPEKSSSQETS